MSIIIQDRDVARKFLQQRRESGNDRWDEVWDGVYILMPNPNVEHQGIATNLAAIRRWAKQGELDIDDPYAERDGDR